MDFSTQWLFPRPLSPTDLAIEPNILSTLEEGFPDMVSVDVLADRCRTFTGKKDVTASDIRRVLTGLQILIPDLIQIEDDKVVISAHPNKLADAVNKQLQQLKPAIETKAP